MQKQKERHSMRWTIIGILLFCWLIPFLFLIGLLGVYTWTNHSDMTAMKYQSQMEFNNRICVERLDRAVAESRQASYDGEILKIRKQYTDGRILYDSAQKKYTEYLYSRYQHSDTVSSVILWFPDGDPAESSSLYRTKGNGNYQQIRNYWENDHEAVAKLAETLDTSVGMMVRGENLYLVRNLMDNRYKPQAVLVFCINQAYCFDSISRYPMQDESCIWIGDQPPLLCDPDKAESWEQLYDDVEEERYAWIGGQLCVTDSRRGDRYQIHSVMKIQKNVTMFPFYGYPYVVGGMVVLLLLMLYIVLRVFRGEVTRPVEALSDGMRRIEQGELGYQIEDRAWNLEFYYLTDSVNRMSDHLKQQFNKIYQEEIALREARIMALQSHINPHFLNNTMEIINWEARLEGNVKVSKMIEALSVMMDAAMDRRKRPQVRLAEEMGYVNSYLYIMKERLGKRLTVEIDIPEELMDCPVPRLILQPVIENAIEHGVVPNGSGTVTIRGYHEGNYLYLEILNDGGMSDEDRRRIARLLDPDYDTSKEPAGNLGIANVNQRLQIMFGAPCGLTMSEVEKNRVTARLTIPWKDKCA